MRRVRRIVSAVTGPGEARGTGWKRLWTVSNTLFFGSFLFSVIVQVNDPDALRWMLLYGAAAAACVLAWWKPAHWVLPALVAVISAAWSASIAPRVVGRVRFGEMFGAFEMDSLAIEESREMYGLLLVVSWMIVLVVRARRLAP